MIILQIVLEALATDDAKNLVTLFSVTSHRQGRQNLLQSRTLV
jgi:hypothetical protein